MLNWKKEQPKTIVLRPPTPEVLQARDVQVAVDYIKGYCRKHPNCSERCRLYDTETERCIFFDGFNDSGGPPCDWELPKREEENGEK